MTHDTDTQDTPIRIVSQAGPFALIPIWVLDYKLSGSQWATYVALRSYAGRGEAYPRVATIAARAHLDHRTTEKALAALREKGLVQSERVYREDGTIAHCTYTLVDQQPQPETAGQGTPAKRPGCPGETAGVPRRNGRGDPGETAGGTPAKRPEQEKTSRKDQGKREDADAGASARTREARRSTKRTSKPLTTIPDDFIVTEDMRRWAAAKCPLTAKHGGRETEKFRNYYLATGRKHRDWVAAWRNWLLRAEEAAERGSGGRYGPNTTPQGPQAAQRPTRPEKRLWTPPAPPVEIADDPAACIQWEQEQRERHERQLASINGTVNGSTGGAW